MNNLHEVVIHCAKIGLRLQNYLISFGEPIFMQHAITGY